MKNHPIHERVLGQFVADKAELYGDRTFMNFEGHTLFYGNAWTIAQGCHKMLASTVDARRSLWFHSGDSGHLDEDDYLYFVDPKKDAIRRRGEYISACQVWGREQAEILVKR